METDRIPIKGAIEVLMANISSIGTVTEWADSMGYSRCYFSLQFHELFEHCAVDILIEIKFSFIARTIIEHPEIKSDADICKTG